MKMLLTIFPLKLVTFLPPAILTHMQSADWVNLSDEELIEKKICHLGLKLDGTEWQPLIQQLYDELSQKKLVFHPPCHVGDE